MGGGGPLTKNFVPSLNMYQAKSGVKDFSLSLRGGGVPRQKFFSQSEHLSSQIWCQKFFPLLGGGGPSTKIFFPQSEHVPPLTQTWTWYPPYLDLDLGPPPTQTWTWDPPTRTWTWDPPHPDLDLGPPHPDLDLGPPPRVWTDKLKTVPSPILRMWAVIIFIFDPLSIQWWAIAGTFALRRSNYTGVWWSCRCCLIISSSFILMDLFSILYASQKVEQRYHHPFLKISK